jgi:hypothetical protein
MRAPPVSDSRRGRAAGCGLGWKASWAASAMLGCKVALASGWWAAQASCCAGLQSSCWAGLAGLRLLLLRAAGPKRVG